MAFSYKSDSLYLENIKVIDIAKSVGTPVYCYSLNTIRKNYMEFAENIPGSLICYAVKANPNVAVIKAIADLGGGADVVSEGEMRRALAAGIPAKKIVFSGVGKTMEEIKFALEHGVYQLNVESLEELFVVNQIASEMEVTASVSIRVNPNLNAETHEKITTGLKVNKFGIPEEIIYEIFTYTFTNVDLVGLSVHIGSQVTDINIFSKLIKKMKEILDKLKKSGHKISRIDLGGGLGIPYCDDDNGLPSITEYANLLRENICNFGYEIICEPGRSIVGNAGLLLTKVLYTKTTDLIKHIIVDAGMNDLIRPALYDSKHKIIPAIKDDHLPKEEIDIVGPVCESDDVFVRDYSIQLLTAGDVLAICETGAYGAAMSSTYNSRLLIPEVLVSNDQFESIKNRGLYEDLLKLDLVPANLYQIPFVS